MGWQPFCFVEYFDIKLEEMVQLMYHFHISPYSTCIIMIICKYIYIYTYAYLNIQLIMVNCYQFVIYASFV